jgi:hypothetical protein
MEVCKTYTYKIHESLLCLYISIYTYIQVCYDSPNPPFMDKLMGHKPASHVRFDSDSDEDNGNNNDNDDKINDNENDDSSGDSCDLNIKKNNSNDKNNGDTYDDSNDDNDNEENSDDDNENDNDNNDNDSNNDDNGSIGDNDDLNEDSILRQKMLKSLPATMTGIHVCIYIKMHKMYVLTCIQISILRYI